MPRLVALAGLDRTALAAAGPDPLQLYELPHLTRLVVRGKADRLAAACAALGLSVPETVGATALREDLRALRLGPDRLVLLAAPDRGAALRAVVEPVLAGRGALVELSEAMTALVLDGPEAALRACLAAGCPLDLHASAFPPGRVAASLFGRLPVWLELEAAERGRLRARLHVDRSLAGTLARHLALATREHGLVLPG